MDPADSPLALLSIIATIGAGGGVGHAIEYAGSTIRAMSMEERMTVCNMSIEAGARAGMAAPDETTYAYLGLAPGTPLAGITVDRVFIGSCTNSRLEDLRGAARVVKGRRAIVPAWIVPGSGLVKRAAEHEGLDRVFVEAGFEAQTVTAPDGALHRFEIDPFRKELLLTGRDEIGLTLDSEARIREFEERHAQLMPWAVPAPR